MFIKPKDLVRSGYKLYNFSTDRLTAEYSKEKQLRTSTDDVKISVIIVRKFNTFEVWLKKTMIIRAFSYNEMPCQSIELNEDTLESARRSAAELFRTFRMPEMPSYPHTAEYYEGHYNEDVH